MPSHTKERASPAALCLPVSSTKASTTLTHKAGCPRHAGLRQAWGHSSEAGQGKARPRGADVRWGKREQTQLCPEGRWRHEIGRGEGGGGAGEGARGRGAGRGRDEGAGRGAGRGPGARGGARAGRGRGEGRDEGRATACGSEADMASLCAEGEGGGQGLVRLNLWPHAELGTGCPRTTPADRRQGRGSPLPLTSVREG